MGDKKPTKLKLIFSCVTFAKRNAAFLFVVHTESQVSLADDCFLSVSLFICLSIYTSLSYLSLTLHSTLSDELNGSKRQPLSNSSVINLFTYIPKKWLIKVLLSIITMYSVFLRNC